MIGAPGARQTGHERLPCHGNRAAPIQHEDAQQHHAIAERGRIHRQGKRRVSHQSSTQAKQRGEAGAHIDLGVARRGFVRAGVEPFPQSLPQGRRVAAPTTGSKAVTTADWQALRPASHRTPTRPDPPPGRVVKPRTETRLPEQSDRLHKASARDTSGRGRIKHPPSCQNPVRLSCLSVTLPLRIPTPVSRPLGGKNLERKVPPGLTEVRRGLSPAP